MVSRFFPLQDAQQFALGDEYEEISLDAVVPSHFLPVAIDPAGNRIVISLAGDDCGAVYYWCWGQEPDPVSCSYEYMRRVAPDFAVFLANLN